MRCEWCHNPESQDKKQEYVNKTIRIGKKEFCEREIIGKYYDADEILNIILEDKDFYEESGGGVTFSGGEPLLQSGFLLEVLKKCKQNDIHVALDTSGNIPPDIFESILEYTDLILYDVKIFDEETHKKYTGVSNKLILKNLTHLSQHDMEIIVRIPVIPGITDTAKNIDQIRKFLNGKIERIDLLPYHSYAKNKYERLGNKFHLKDVDEPGSHHMKELSDHLSSSGFTVQIGG